ncbi:type 1 glutamine amidotransferase domain-containing protein [Paucilactobacillus suebicus]|uniref:ThiJ PfpI family protein n=1 Tax=Paucilactobacillus suebicus DSM 5007 = KCTC 3549 TaxID=1423807 RepID=A0A0R1VZY9_9LACO|nr:type 1 glutamine amidotransferase domain-containing protein [Paucilactobacillus suebicus]KRM11184.1 ThiJ PfpI family protein [Paucilactobacillus suebicus DSM 5007 = KCTC 3549]
MTKVLVVLTNHQKFDTINRATGLWLSEATHFVNVMKNNNIGVDYVSPKGGYVPVDPGSMDSSQYDEINHRFYDDAEFRNQALGASLKPSEVQAANYDAIYFAGGHGTVWDFPNNTELGLIAKQIYDKGGIISAVCHGVVGLLSIEGDTGKFINGKNLTGFTNEEEKINELTNDVPFLAEDALKNAGATHNASAPYTKNVVVDGRLITGQNPQSAEGVGEALIDALK